VGVASVVGAEDGDDGDVAGVEVGHELVVVGNFWLEIWYKNPYSLVI
jgi:hypothetical protein